MNMRTGDGSLSCVTGVGTAYRDFVSFNETADLLVYKLLNSINEYDLRYSVEYGLPKPDFTLNHNSFDTYYYSAIYNRYGG